MDRRHLIGTLAAGTLGFTLSGRASEAVKEVPTAGLPGPYKARIFPAEGGLPGLSKDLVAEHLGLYKGYVNRTNALLAEVLALEKTASAATATQESRRRLGFEFSGMRLHEFYFEALRDKPAGPGGLSGLQKAIAATWGSHDAWWAAFKTTCTMTGIGWGALVKDPFTGRLMNAWFQDHENSIPVGTVPILLVDVWEHAYVKDYGAAGRGKYVDAIRPLIDWAIVEQRY